MRDLPPVSTLRAFEATARLGTMTAAATELGRTHGAVSRQIGQLERAVGCPLFLRRGPALALTPAGRELFTAATDALDTLERCYARLRGGARHEVVRFGCGSTFASRWLIPRLPRFYRRRPGVTVRIDVIKRFAPEARGVDLVTSWDRLSYPTPEGDHVSVLGDVCFVMAGHPRLACRTSGAQVEIATRIRSATSPRYWESFEQRTGLTIAAGAELEFANTQQCIEAALAGLGHVLTEVRLIEHELADGRLSVSVPGWTVPGGLVALRVSRRPLTSTQRALVGWLADEAQAGLPQPRVR